MIETHTVSITRRLREWLEPRMDTADKVDITERLPEAIEEFKRDEEFVQQFLSEELLPHLLFVARQIMSSYRVGRGRRIIQSGNILQTEEDFNREAAVKEFGFNRVWIHAQGKYFRFTRMNKPLLESSIQESSPRQKTERVDRRFRLMVKSSLPDDTSTVEEILTEEQLGELWDIAQKEIEEEMNHEEVKYG